MGDEAKARIVPLAPRTTAAAVRPVTRATGSSGGSAAPRRRGLGAVVMTSVTTSSSTSMLPPPPPLSVVTHVHNSHTAHARLGAVAELPQHSLSSPSPSLAAAAPVADDATAVAAEHAVTTTTTSSALSSRQVLCCVYDAALHTLRTRRHDDEARLRRLLQNKDDNEKDEDDDVDMRTTLLSLLLSLCRDVYERAEAVLVAAAATTVSDKDGRERDDGAQTRAQCAQTTAQLHARVADAVCACWSHDDDGSGGSGCDEEQQRWRDVAAASTRLSLLCTHKAATMMTAKAAQQQQPSSSSSRVECNLDMAWADASAMMSTHTAASLAHALHEHVLQPWLDCVCSRQHSSRRSGADDDSDTAVSQRVAHLHAQMQRVATTARAVAARADEAAVAVARAAAAVAADDAAAVASVEATGTTSAAVTTATRVTDTNVAQCARARLQCSMQLHTCVLWWSRQMLSLLVWLLLLPLPMSS